MEEAPSDTESSAPEPPRPKMHSGRGWAAIFRTRMRRWWDREATWVRVGALAMIATAIIAAVGGPVRVWIHLDEQRAAGEVSSSPATSASAPGWDSRLIGANDQGCGLSELPKDVTTNDLALCILAEGANGEQRRDVATFPLGTVGVFVEYMNTGGLQQDDVTFRVTLPDGLALVPGTSVMFNSKVPEGALVSDNLPGAGINIGSYAPGGNAFVFFEVQTGEAELFPCGESREVVTFRVTVAGWAKSADSVVSIIRQC